MCDHYLPQIFQEGWSPVDIIMALLHSQPGRKRSSVCTRNKNTLFALQWLPQAHRSAFTLARSCVMISQHQEAVHERCGDQNKVFLFQWGIT